MENTFSSTRSLQEMRIVILLSVLSLTLLLGARVIPVAANHEQIQIDRDFKDNFEESTVLEIEDPTDLEFSPDEKLLLVTTKNGKLWAVDKFDGPNSTKKEALDINSRMCTNGERGLTGVAFHPNFERTRWVYLFYTHDKYNDCWAGGKYKDRGPVNRLSRFILLDSNDIDLDSETIFFETPRVANNHHNAGDIAFGKDGMLYVTVGDGGARTLKNDNGAYYPQALDKMLGKLIRLTDTGDIPDDNPYTPSQGHNNTARCSKTGGEAPRAYIKCEEIYVSGLRNPWRFAMDPNYDGVRYFINAVGRHTWESVFEGGDWLAGANYGYPFREGPCLPEQVTNCKPSEWTDPIHWYHHDDEDGGAVTGAAFVPNNIGWPASFQNSYLYAEYARGGIYRITPGGKGCAYPTCDPPISDYEPTRQVFSSLKKVVSMQWGPYKNQKALYVLTRGDTGHRGVEGVFRIFFSGLDNRSPKAKIDTSTTIGFPPMVVKFDGLRSFDPDGEALTYAWDFDGDGVSDSSSSSASYEYTSSGSFVATLTVWDSHGAQDSANVRIDVDYAPPLPKIASPEEGTKFAVGDTLTLRGSAPDIEGDDIRLTWQVRLHHGDHFHQVLDPTGGGEVEVIAPEPMSFEAATTSYLVLLLTATDSRGLSATVSRICRPKMVEFVLDSNPSGLHLTANSEQFLTPATVTTWENHRFEISTVDDASYLFEKWSDGGDKSHEYVASSLNPLPIVAEFKSILPKVQIDSPTDGITFAVGDIFVLSGTATNGAGVEMPDSTLTWEVRLSDGKKEGEIFLPPTVGNDIVLNGAPAPVSFDFASTDVYLEVILTATSTSSLGISSTKRLIWPKKVDLVFDTKPSGLHLILNGEMIQTPASITTWEKHSFEISAPSQRMGHETVSTYVWNSWSDGGSQSHEYVALKSGNGLPHTVVANFIRLAFETKAASESTQIPSSAASSFIIALGAIGVAVTVVIVGWSWQRGARRNGTGRDEEMQHIDFTVDTLETKERYAHTKESSVDEAVRVKCRCVIASGSWFDVGMNVD